MFSRAYFLLGAVTAAVALLVLSCAGGGASATATPAKAPTGATPAVATPGVKATTGAAAPAKGNADTGKQLIVQKGCSSCHVVPGVPEAKGTIGPNLGGVASRSMIAGTLQNNPENMEKWLKNPPGVKPGTQMPNLNLTDTEVANLVAFLLTLK